MSDGEAVIETRGLRRVYHMGAHTVEALCGADLRIEAGEFVAIIGPSGSGKSTLMYLLGCLDTPSAGSYRLCGREVASCSDAELSRLRNRAIGYVFQQFFLLADLDAGENAALATTYAGVPRAERRAVAGRLGERLGLGDRLHHKPNELSGGQQQRVAIARALATDPALILADEPTGNLDSHTSAEIMRILRDLHASGRTVVVVTHDGEVAAQADRVITLRDGHIVDDRRRDAAPRPAAAPHASGVVGSGHLGWRDLLRISLREGILAHKLRSFLTMLGIIFGIAAVIAMTAITEGGKQQQLQQLRQIGLNSVQIHDADLSGARLLRARRLNPHGITVRDLEHLQTHLPGLRSATAWKQLLAELRRGRALVEDAEVLGCTGEFPRTAAYAVAHGRFPDAIDAERFARVCALGPAVASRLGIASDDLGQSVLIGDEPFTVVGIMARKEFSASSIGDVTIADRNQQVFVPLATLRRYFPRDDKASELDTILLSMASDEALVERSRLARHIIAGLHRDAEDFVVSVPVEKLAQARATRDVFNLIIIVIAGVSLVVGGIGIMNIMLATVTERTQEIGIRRAIGAARRDILAQFLAEALLLAACGGIAGICAGILGALVVQALFGFPVAFSVPIIVVAAVVSMGVGVVFGLYPAWLAAHKDPVEALRN